MSRSTKDAQAEDEIERQIDLALLRDAEKPHGTTVTVHGDNHGQIAGHIETLNITNHFARK